MSVRSNEFTTGSVLPDGPRPHGRDCTTAWWPVLLQCLTRLVVALFVVGSAVSLILWLSMHPRLPAFHVESLSVSGFNLSVSQLTAKYSIGLNVTNPNNKIDLQIDQFDLSVVYRGVPLSRMVRGFSPSLLILRNHGSQVEFEKGTDQLNKKTRKRIIGNLAGKGVVSFNVRMNVRVKFQAYRWLTKRKALVVLCKNQNVVFAFTHGGSGTGKLVEGWKSCIVDFD